MPDAVTRAQIQLLAQLLGADPAELAGLERLGAENIEALRQRISAEIFDTHAAAFARVSKLAPIVPNALLVKVVPKVVPPEIAGRAGSALGVDHRDRAVGVLSGLSPGYMADAAPHIDPRVIPVLAPHIPAELIIPTANELLRRGDYLTASRFVEFGTEPIIRELLPAIDDDEGILRTAALVSANDQLNEILRIAGAERGARLAATAATASPDTVVAALTVFARLEPELALPLGDTLFSSDGLDGVARILRIAVDAEALAELLDVVDIVSDETVGRVAQSGVFGEEAIARTAESATTTNRRRRAWRRLEAAMRDAAATATN